MSTLPYRWLSLAAVATGRRLQIPNAVVGPETGPTCADVQFPFDERTSSDTCSDWVGYNCSRAVQDFAYSYQRRDLLFASCPETCGILDVPDFADEQNRTCAVWAGYNCSRAMKDFGYTRKQQDLLTTVCAKTCGTCPDPEVLRKHDYGPLRIADGFGKFSRRLAWMTELIESEPSTGCRASPEALAPGVYEETLMWSEEGLPDIKRRYLIHVPKGYVPGTPTPLFFGFHGWGETGKAYHDTQGWDALSENQTFISVFPEGIADCVEDKEGADCAGVQSWNGAGTASSTDAKMSCLPSRQELNTCYNSCRIKKRGCNRCDWAHCYDDIGFITTLLEDIKSRVCIDELRIFAWGCSNGGVFLFDLPNRLPGVFAAISASCGAKPHRGWENGLPKDGPPVSLLLLNGRGDTTIPKETPDPNVSWWDGWYFAGQSSVLQSFSAYNHCKDRALQLFPNALVGGNMKCWVSGSECRGDAGVMHCDFDAAPWWEGHDVNMHVGDDDIPDGPQMIWLFFKAHPMVRN